MDGLRNGWCRMGRVNRDWWLWLESLAEAVDALANGGASVTQVVEHQTRHP